KEYCEKQIREHEEQNKLDQIIQSNDVSRCDELSEEVYSTLCRSFFGIESGPETIEPEGAEEAVNQ
ncbi:hypothetical protein KJ657_05040, partial [Patescibacteria group bacterium]|nr:hypothetical protein [Patescibacteria group bacterium]